MVHIGINGFGRIGRLALRAALLYYPDIHVGAVNTSDSMKLADWAMLFKYDSVYGQFPASIRVESSDDPVKIGSLVVGETKIPFTAIKDPALIPWREYGAEIILESTGVFRDSEKAKAHFVGGGTKVLISAPAKGDDIPFVIVGVNAREHKDKPILSNCSCTTYSVVPIAKTMLDHFPILKASLTTIHAYTADQQLVDGSHKKDIRRARAAALNIVPTTSGSAQAVIKVLPELSGKFEAFAIRVPVPVGSLSDLTFFLENETTRDEVNKTLIETGQSSLKGILDTTTYPIVSSDVIGTRASAIVDLTMTQVIGGNLVKVFAWYDNEFSYACRLLELAQTVNSYAVET